MIKGDAVMGVSRRGFIGGLGAAAAAPRLFAKAPGDYDPDLTVLLSDLHVNGTEDSHQLGRLERAVGEILAENPGTPDIGHFAEFIRATERGIMPGDPKLKSIGSVADEEDEE